MALDLVVFLRFNRVWELMLITQTQITGVLRISESALVED